MWIAWANVRLSGLWGTMDGSDVGVLDLGLPAAGLGSSEWDDYDWALIHAMQLEPIIDRMIVCRRPHVTRMVSVDRDLQSMHDLAKNPYEVLDLRKVSNIRMDTPDLPFKKLPNMVDQWNRTSAVERAKYFSNLMKVAPAHKK